MAVIGPWPVDDSARGLGRTFERIEAAPAIPPAGPIRVGVAEVDLTPKSPRPLAGFIGQVRTPYVGVDSPCLGRALTVESGSGEVTILTADLLLINAKLAAAIVAKAGVRPDQVYFTASHTHGGPGGWGDHPLEALVAGAYDPAYFDDLADRLSGAVRRSRASTAPAEFGLVQVEAPGRQKNRIEPASTTHDALSALIFRPIGGGPPMAILAIFGAHATVSHPVPPRLGGDYPAALASALKRSTGAGSVLFAAGAVGDASPARLPARSQRESAEALGSALAEDLSAAIGPARFDREVVLAGLRVDVDLPPLRLPFFSPWLRFSPAATWWIAGRRTHLHALRIGPAVLVGFPGDYSGHLADRLVAETRPSGLVAVATSFDGDFKGYLVSESIHRRRSCYETRWMSFFGPSIGDDLTDAARLMVDRLAGRPGRSVEASRFVEWPCRVTLGFLIAVGWARFGRWPRGLGLVTGGMVAVAAGTVLVSVVAPDWVDWSMVGLPTWSRFVGIPIGLWAIIRPLRLGGRAVLPFAVACFLLSASWPVAIAAARGWLLSMSASSIPVPSSPSHRRRLNFTR